MFFDDDEARLGQLHEAIARAYLCDEEVCVNELLERWDVVPEVQSKVQQVARELVETVRAHGQRTGGIEAFLQEFGLSTEEGVVLMCLAEALLRIPDNDTADRLIRDKLTTADWKKHVGHSHSLFVNASTWGLMLTGRIVKGGLDGEAIYNRLLANVGEPVIRPALKQAMRILGRQFVMGEDIHAACTRATQNGNARYRYSYDMLGEAAITMDDAERYFAAYKNAIESLAQYAEGKELIAAPSISIKLSALHPRYEFQQQSRVLNELVPRLQELVNVARASGVAVTVDAEEAERLELSLAVFEKVYAQLNDWDGFGLAVQAYQKRGLTVLEWLAELADKHQRRIPVRLVKGAYWDTEIKRAQERGLEDYPVFTRKQNTDLSYLVCARFMLQSGNAFYPQFATHNAHTVASILAFAEPNQGFEFQRLHGMGEALYEEVFKRGEYACRVYAPVGSHQDLLPYLVRRLMENGANTSFVNRIENQSIDVEEIVRDPVEQARAFEQKRHVKIDLPKDLYGGDRKNSHGLNVFDHMELSDFARHIRHFLERPYKPKLALHGDARLSHNPAAQNESVGEIKQATKEDMLNALDNAYSSYEVWRYVNAAHRASLLRQVADMYEQNYPALVALCVKEGGRCLADAIADVREAVDFCRYYAQQLLEHHAMPMELPGPTGEYNVLRLHGRGVFLCISPWNFPVAIFTGQIAAAIAAGNTVLAKPAGQTPLTGAFCVELFHRAGLDERCLQLLPGSGKLLGETLLSDRRLAGVAFTGSTDTARFINQTLAAREGPIVPLIAETGGQNVMLVDSSALPEQVVKDAVFSAFNSAGQRCSALRVLLLQKEIAPKVIDLMCGAMQELVIGDPMRISTDVGPVIDAEAKAKLLAHVDRMDQEATLLAKVRLPDNLGSDNFFPPHMYLIKDLEQLQGEVFGPVLHVMQYKAHELEAVIKNVNAMGYGLTLGIHSRVESTIRYIEDHARVGNVYVNRNMVGAVVGVQPFGGEGLSGTGPKAGGPHYLMRFATEQALSNNTAAVGGNVALLGGLE